MAEIIQFTKRQEPPAQAPRRLAPGEYVVTPELLIMAMQALHFYANQGFDHGDKARTVLDKIHCASFTD